MSFRILLDVLPACTDASSISNLCSICFGGNILCHFPWVGLIGEEFDWCSAVRVLSKSSSLVLGEALEFVGNILLLKAVIIYFFPLRRSISFLRVIYFQFVFWRSWPSRFLKTISCSFGYTCSLVTLSNVAVLFDIANPKDWIILYFRKLYTWFFLLSPVL